MSITLKPITDDNWREAYALKVSENQKHLIADNGYSLVQAMYDLPYQNKATGIYHADTMVGFMMTGMAIKDNEVDTRWIYRFMIGAEYQQRGYGRKALELYLAQMQTASKYKRIKISYAPQNHIAKALYESIGFIVIGLHKEWNEMVAVYTPTDRD